MNNRRKQLMLASAREYCKCVVEGKTIKYNQLLQTTHFSNVSAPQTLDTFDMVNGHKYMFVQKYSRPSASSQDTDYQVYFYGSGGLDEQNINLLGNFIYNASITTEVHLMVHTYSQFGGAIDFSIMVIDLTTLGLDSISSPSEFYETDLGKYIAKGNYLETTSGKFINAKTPINFRGVNIWDENWENGIWYYGSKLTSGGYANFVCSKEKMKVYPNTKYFYYCGTGRTNDYIQLEFYDKNGTTISRLIKDNNSSFVTPNGCCSMAFYINDSYGTTYNHDICISENAWDENYDNCYYDESANGEKVSSSGAFGCASKISVMPSSKLQLISSTSYSTYVLFYDKNGNYLNDYVNGYGNLEFVTPKNCYYITFYVASVSYNNDIAIFYYGYQRYCGTNVLMEGFVFQKGDKYKSWGLDEISYNQLVQNGNFVNTNNWIAQYGTLSVSNNIGTLTCNGNNPNARLEQNVSLTANHKYLICSNMRCSNTRNGVCNVGGASSTSFTLTANQWNFIAQIVTTSANYNSIMLQLTDAQSGDILDYQNYMLFDLTALGLDNATTLEEFYRTPLGRLVAKGYYLPYATTNKTTKEQLVRTMKEIDLSSLTWTYISAMTSHSAVLPSDIKENTQNAIAEKYKQFVGTGYPQRNCFKITSGTIVVNTGSSTQPSGKILIELEQPTLMMWQTLDIGDYHEFVATDTPNIFKLNRDLSDYGVIDITTDYGTKMSNLTQLNIFGGDGDYCYQDGFIYQKSSDIENAWIYQIQISNAPSRMVSRRTINVESDNGVDLDFTKE